MKGVTMPGTPMNRDFKDYPACIFEVFANCELPRIPPGFYKRLKHDIMIRRIT